MTLRLFILSILSNIFNIFVNLFPTLIAFFRKTSAIAVATLVMPSTVLGNGSDSEYIDAPFFVPHFFLDCSIGGHSASTELPVHALVDNSSDSVLIDLVYA